MGMTSEMVWLFLFLGTGVEIPFPRKGNTPDDFSHQTSLFASLGGTLPSIGKPTPYLGLRPIVQDSVSEAYSHIDLNSHLLWEAAI